MGNMEWQSNHTEEIERLVKEYLPSGSGIDSGNKFDFDDSTGEKLVFNSSFHVMNENGCYDGWIDYQVVVKGDLQFDIDMKIKGRFGDNQDLKDYLYDTYNLALMSPVSE
jgi:hypothetical protein